MKVGHTCSADNLAKSIPFGKQSFLALMIKDKIHNIFIM
jgi:hypothetical protein